jgi:hypothetical protein
MRLHDEPTSLAGSESTDCHIWPKDTAVALLELNRVCTNHDVITKRATEVYRVFQKMRLFDIRHWR